MPILNTRIEDIKEKELEALIENKVKEGKIIDYKQELPGDTHKPKREFLADVSSFANASGGHVVFGMREVAGVPIELKGLEVGNIDTEKSRLDNIIRNGIDPRLPNVKIADLELSNGRCSIIIYIPRSWRMPHAVNFEKHWRFYSRNSSGKYPLDVSEVASLFRMSDSESKRIKNFRYERISHIVANEIPVKFEEGTALVVFHLIPFGSFSGIKRLNLQELVDKVEVFPSLSINGRFHNYFYTFDGLLTYVKPSQSTQVAEYSLLFHNGCIEAIDSFMLSERGFGRTIPSKTLEGQLIKALTNYLKVLKFLNIEMPIFIMLSLLGVYNYRLAVDKSIDDNKSRLIDRPDLIIPEIMIEDYDSDPKEVLKPIFDLVWNAAGYPYSMNL